MLSYFSDVQTMEITAKALTEMTAIWKEELKKETKGGQNVRKGEKSDSHGEKVSHVR